MGANNPLSGALKGDVLMTESPAKRAEQKIGGMNEADRMEKHVGSSRTYKYSQ